MFAGFESAIPERLAPSLEVGTVAGLVERTVLSGESQVRRRFVLPSLEASSSVALKRCTSSDDVCLTPTLPRIAQHLIEPFYAKCTPLGRALPTWLYGAILLCVVPSLSARASSPRRLSAHSCARMPLQLC